MDMLRPQWLLVYQWGFQYQREWGKRGVRGVRGTSQNGLVLPDKHPCNRCQYLGAPHLLQLSHSDLSQTPDAFDAAACPCPPPPLQDRGVDFPVRPQEAGVDAGAPYYTPPAMPPAAVAAAQGLSPEDRAAIAGT